MEQIAVALLGLSLFLTAASGHSTQVLRVSLLPAILLATAALLRHPSWPVPALILVLGGGVIWSLSGKLKRGAFVVEREGEMEAELKTRALDRALNTVPDTDPPLLVLLAQLLAAGAVIVCVHLSGGLSGAGCLGALLLGFVLSLLLVRRPLSTWSVAVALAWVVWAARPGLAGDQGAVLSGLGLLGALVLASVHASFSVGIVSVILSLLAASSAVRPLGGLVSWFPGWAMLIGLVLLYFLVGVGADMRRPEQESDL